MKKKTWADLSTRERALGSALMGLLVLGAFLGLSRPPAPLAYPFDVLAEATSCAELDTSWNIYLDDRNEIAPQDVGRAWRERYDEMGCTTYE